MLYKKSYRFYFSNQLTPEVANYGLLLVDRVGIISIQKAPVLVVFKGLFNGLL